MVLWTCVELELPFEREDWAGPFRSPSEPAFLALNPVGLVPVIDDDGAGSLSGSPIRCDPLPCGQPPPRGSAARGPAPAAQVEMWMDWQASDFNNSWRVAFQGLVRKKPRSSGPAGDPAIARHLLPHGGRHRCGTRQVGQLSLRRKLHFGGCRDRTLDPSLAVLSRPARFDECRWLLSAALRTARLLRIRARWRALIVWRSLDARGRRDVAGQRVVAPQLGRRGQPVEPDDLAPGEVSGKASAHDADASSRIC